MSFVWRLEFALLMTFFVGLSPTFAALHGKLVSCSALSIALPDKVSYPGNATYDSSVDSYWFQEARLSPSCIISPTSASDVALIVMTLSGHGRKHSSLPKFAIRSGGHTPFAGAANIEDGITIDLRAMNAVSLNSDRTIASAGAGSNWDDIYKILQPMNLTVVGGRVAGIGVGGLTTGGGISFLSPERGFACDNIVNIEVVLANGQIVSANAQQNPDLFAALKGGSNNFGIVTRFDFQTFSLGNFWGGFIQYPESTIPQQLQAFEYFMSPGNFDPKAEMISGIGYIEEARGVIVSNGIYYTEPIAEPPIFRPFTAIQPQLGNTMRVSDIIDFVEEGEKQQTRNPRGIYANTVFSLSASILTEVYGLWNSTIDSIKHVDGIQHFVIFQRVPAAMQGTSLGIKAQDGPLVLCLLAITWNRPGDDELINSVAKTLLTQIERTTKAAGLFNRWKYLNYAANFQDPITSYGEASKANLQDVSKRYDPTGLFQTGVPGGFKLF